MGRVICTRPTGWILEIDITSYFDNLDQDLLMRAVKKHAKDRWVVLYIERWRKAPVQEEDGRLVPREKGTPQGGVISPLLANLFLHYALDRWLAANYPQVTLEEPAAGILHGGVCEGGTVDRSQGKPTAY